MALWVITSFLVVLLGLGSVAFITLLERKLLGLSQVRLGPNKVTLFGLLQPVADGVKLLFKQLYVVSWSQFFLFISSPGLLMMLYSVIWIWFVPWDSSLFFGKFSSLVFFSLLGVSTYAVILTGWSSSSSFSKLGSLRGILQSLSFEVALILMFMCILELTNSFSLKMESSSNFELLLSWSVVWIILSLMESNRAPFDLLEGESELISGFNIEMGSLTFVYLFLSEYGMIIVLSFFTSVALFGKVTAMGMLFVCAMLFMRSCFPRIRYDVMMNLMWQSVLPLGVLYFFFFWML